MRSTLALIAAAGSAAAQAVTGIIVPSSTPPAGCQNSIGGTFAISVVNASTPAPTPSGKGRRDAPVAFQAGGGLQITLSGGVLHDQDNRVGYIASNYQFQFDGPPQSGAIYTGGFSVCSNNSLALGGSAVFWQCLSGTFYNLYDRDWATHCNPVYFQVADASGAPFSTAPPGPVSTGPDQATIKNGGGTQSMNQTATGISAGASGSASGTGPASASATASGTSKATGTGSTGAGSTGTGTGASSAGSTGGASSSSSAGLAAAFATQAPQAVLGWAVGLVGALAFI